MRPDKMSDGRFRTLRRKRAGLFGAAFGMGIAGFGSVVGRDERNDFVGFAGLFRGDFGGGCFSSQSKASRSAGVPFVS